MNEPTKIREDDIDPKEVMVFHLNLFARYCENIQGLRVKMTLLAFLYMSLLSDFSLTHKEVRKGQKIE